MKKFRNLIILGLIAVSTVAAGCTPREVAAFKSLSPSDQTQIINHLQTTTTTPPANTCSDSLTYSTTNCQIGWDVAKSKGYTASQFSCLDYIIDRESGWIATIKNAGGSSAYGIPQALPGRKMASHGSDWATNPSTQVRWMLDYVDSRYGGPCSAKSFKVSKGWY